MYFISNEQYGTIIRLLSDFMVSDKEKTTRAAERRRKALKTLKYLKKKGNIMDNTTTRQDVLDFEDKIRERSIATIHKIAHERNTITGNMLNKRTDSYTSMLGE